MSEYMFPSLPIGELQISGAVIRIDPDLGVYIHANSSHHAIGVTDAYIDDTDGSLVVVRDNNNPVVSTSVTPDEALTDRGIHVGLSGGGQISKVFFYDINGNKLLLHGPNGFAAVASSVSNIWFMTVNHVPAQ